jgi:hypothetical protein
VFTLGCFFHEKVRVKLIFKKGLATFWAFFTAHTFFAANTFFKNGFVHFWAAFSTIKSILIRFLKCVCLHFWQFFIAHPVTLGPNFGKKLAFLTQNKAKLCKILIITLVFEKNANFFAKNCHKSQKIMIITSTPGCWRKKTFRSVCRMSSCVGFQIMHPQTG